MGLDPLVGLGEQEAVDAHEEENHQIHVQSAQQALGGHGIDDVEEDEGAGDPHEGLEGVHVLGSILGLLGAPVGLGLHVGFGGDVAQLHQFMLARTGEEDQQDEHDSQDDPKDDVHGVVAGVGDAHGLAYDFSIGAAFGGQVGVQSGGGPKALAQDHAGVAAGHHHGEVEALDALGEVHGQNGGDDGAEGPVQHGGHIAEDHQHDQSGGAGVHQAGDFVEQLGGLGAAGTGGGDDDHQAHLEGQGKLAAQAIPPGNQKIQRGLAAEQKGQDKDGEHQDDTEYKGIRNDHFGGKAELLADPPK